MKRPECIHHGQRNRVGLWTFDGRKRGIASRMTLVAWIRGGTQCLAQALRGSTHPQPRGKEYMKDLLSTKEVHAAISPTPCAFHRQSLLLIWLLSDLVLFFLPQQIMALEHVLLWIVAVRKT